MLQKYRSTTSHLLFPSFSVQAYQEKVAPLMIRVISVRCLLICAVHTPFLSAMLACCCCRPGSSMDESSTEGFPNHTHYLPILIHSWSAASNHPTELDVWLVRRYIARKQLVRSLLYNVHNQCWPRALYTNQFVREEGASVASNHGGEKKVGGRLKIGGPNRLWVKMHLPRDNSSKIQRWPR